jgi:hypothetical protein
MLRTLFGYIPSLENIVSFGNKRVAVPSQEEGRDYKHMGRLYSAKAFFPIYGRRRHSFLN